MGPLYFKISSKVTFFPFSFSSWYCLINMNRTGSGNLSLLSLWTASAGLALLPVPVQTIARRPGISFCSRLRLSLPTKGLFLARW